MEFFVRWVQKRNKNTWCITFVSTQLDFSFEFLVQSNYEWFAKKMCVAMENNTVFNFRQLENIFYMIDK